MTGTRQKWTTRRQVLLSTAVGLILAVTKKAGAVIIRGAQPWRPFDASSPETANDGGWQFFTADEAASIEAITARLIPADELSISGKDAGCAVFIDRQLAGPYGTAERLYMQGPFRDGTPEQGDQSALTPQQRYRIGLAALDAYCTETAGQKFAKLPAQKQDEVLTGLENGTITLKTIDARLLFSTVHANTMEGFFADPVYGGNRDMVSWKMLGFPGARYDYRAYIEKHNQKLDLPPLSIAGRPEWNVKG